jgi:hypothetical protein
LGCWRHLDGEHRFFFSRSCYFFSLDLFRVLVIVICDLFRVPDLDKHVIYFVILGGDGSQV